MTSPNEEDIQPDYQNGFRNNYVRRPRPPYIEVDEDVAFELMEAVKNARQRLLLSRAEMVEDGNKEGVQYYNYRLDNIATARRRLIGVCNRFKWDMRSPMRDD